MLRGEFQDTINGVKVFGNPESGLMQIVEGSNGAARTAAAREYAEALVKERLVIANTIRSISIDDYENVPDTYGASSGRRGELLAQAPNGVLIFDIDGHKARDLTQVLSLQLLEACDEGTVTGTRGLPLLLPVIILTGSEQDVKELLDACAELKARIHEPVRIETDPARDAKRPNQKNPRTGTRIRIPGA